MLKAQEKSQQDGHEVIQCEERGSASLPFHERKVGSEEECIVVSSNEAIPKDDQYKSLR